MKRVLLLSLQLISITVLSQEIKIKGRLLDYETGCPLEMMNVLEVGLINGTVTDSLGNFEFEMSSPQHSLKLIGFSYFPLEIINLPEVETLNLGDIHMFRDYSQHIIIELSDDIMPDEEKYETVKRAIQVNYIYRYSGGNYKFTIVEDKIVLDLK